MKVSYKIGDEVKFWDDSLFVQYGIIVKLNRKTAKVQSYDGYFTNIPYQKLTW